MEPGLLIVSQDGVTWGNWCALADACERFGVSTMLTCDHYVSRNDELKNLAHDAWTIIAALAVRTSSLRLVTLVSPATFRSRAVIANVAATADHVSGGRVKLGLGSGWFRREHEAFGFPFPPLRVRQEMFAGQIEIVHRLWTQDRVTFHGNHYHLDEASGMPKPLSNPPGIVVGGVGSAATTIPTARFASDYNTEWRAHPREFESIRAAVRERCAAEGRDPDTMRFSIASSETHARMSLQERMPCTKCALKIRPSLTGLPMQVKQGLSAPSMRSRPSFVTTGLPAPTGYSASTTIIATSTRSK